MITDTQIIGQLLERINSRLQGHTIKTGTNDPFITIEIDGYTDQMCINYDDVITFLQGFEKGLQIQKICVAK